MGWKTVRYLAIVIAITVIVVNLGGVLFDQICVHQYETSQVTERIIPYDGYWEHDVRKFKEKTEYTHHLKCSECGKVTFKKTGL